MPKNPASPRTPVVRVRATFEMPPELAHQLKAAAFATGVTMNHIITSALTQHLSRLARRVERPARRRRNPPAVLHNVSAKEAKAAAHALFAPRTA